MENLLIFFLIAFLMLCITLYARRIMKYQYEKLFTQLELKNEFIDHIEQRARELAKQEDIPIISVSFEELNVNETVEKDKALAVFVYLKNDALKKYNDMLTKYKKILEIEPLNDEEKYPHIKMSEKADVFSLIHELGHYFLYKKNIEQSEDAANYFILEFFENYLPPFFKCIYQINIKIRCKTELKFTYSKLKQYYKDYQDFKMNFEN